MTADFIAKRRTTDNMNDRSAKKILVLGPCKAGKSAISTYLAEAIDSDSLGEYRPTKGVRIVEFESHELDIRGKRVEIDVELWDCSGDLRYRDCWPALREDVAGVILVANPDEDKGDDLHIWFTEFIEKTNLRHDNVMVVLNEKGDKKTNSGSISEFKVLAGLTPAEFVGCNLRHEGEQLKTAFNSFLVNILERDETIF